MSLVSEAERQNTLVALPEPVDARLDLLIRVARGQGVQVNRSQMLAALVTSAPKAPDRLSRMVRRYLAMKLQTFAADYPVGELPEVKRRGRRRS